MKNKIIIVILGLMLSLPVISQAEPDIGIENQIPVAEEQSEEIIPVNTEQNLDDEEGNILDTNASNNENLLINNGQYKKPISKRRLAKKFLLAMFGVVVSSLMIYVLLTLYNKVRENVLNQTKTLDGEVSLDIPDDVESAVKTFLEKTKWN